MNESNDAVSRVLVALDEGQRATGYEALYMPGQARGVSAKDLLAAVVALREREAALRACLTGCRVAMQATANACRDEAAHLDRAVRLADALCAGKGAV